jgi:hypothetical protein
MVPHPIRTLFVSILLICTMRQQSSGLEAIPTKSPRNHILVKPLPGKTI